jgi:hypothetical protein
MEEKKKTLFVNLISGPGTGKSTLCAWVFTELKIRGIDCEMALEYAKDVVWEESYKKLNNQIYIFGKQHNRVFRLNGKVDVVITDSSILFSPIYDQTKNPVLKELAILEFTKLNNINFFIERATVFSQNGRVHGEEISKGIDSECKAIMEENGIPYQPVTSSEEGKNLIVSSIIEILESNGSGRK